MPESGAFLQPLSPTPENIARAGELLQDGQLVGFPTETVYGLGANATDDRAVARIFEAKDRPHFNPLIVHVPDMAMAQTLGRFDGRAKILVEKFWPGPLTVVVPRSETCPASKLVSAGIDTIALRIPADGLAQKILAAAGVPLAAPSANRSGKLSPTRAAHVANDLGTRVSMILDGGDCSFGIESTVVGLAGERAQLFRPGAVEAAAIEAIIGPLEQPGKSEGAMSSPGMLESHYAPERKLRMNVHDAGDGEVLLAFGPNAPDGAMRSLNLSPTGDLVEAAANLFAMLHELDSGPAKGIAVMPIPEAGLGIAINDRLRRASA